MVTFDDGNGHVFAAGTKNFGYYNMENVPTGLSYNGSASARRKTFAPHSLDVNDAVENVDFVANP